MPPPSLAAIANREMHAIVPRPENRGQPRTGGGWRSLSSEILPYFVYPMKEVFVPFGEFSEEQGPGAECCP